MQSGNMLVAEEFGFIQGISAENATFMLVDGSKCSCWWNILLLAKAFVCVNHGIEGTVTD
jgi:hypothetical protein